MKDSNSEPTNRIQRAKEKSKKGMVKACPRKFERVLANRNLTPTEIEKKCDVSRTWIYKVKQGEEVRRSMLEMLCQCLEIPIEHLLPDQARLVKKEHWSLTPPLAWEITDYFGPFRQTLNGLSYRVTRLRHKFVEGKYARGKFYDLLHVNSQLQQELIHQLTRHAQVCTRIGSHPHIAENLDVIPQEGENGWWVLDTWIDGTALEQIVRETEFELKADWIRKIGEEILLGLSALHKSDVILRELAPDKVWISSDQHQVVLTEFELAKLLGGAPSVSEFWQDGYFRAPEVSNYDAYFQSDFYSWGKIIRWIIENGANQNGAKHKLSLPPMIDQLVDSCLSSRPTKRPRSADRILETWLAWK